MVRIMRRGETVRHDTLAVPPTDNLTDSERRSLESKDHRSRKVVIFDNVPFEERFSEVSPLLISPLDMRQ
jgi:hypothetical protein